MTIDQPRGSAASAALHEPVNRRSRAEAQRHKGEALTTGISMMPPLRETIPLQPRKILKKSLGNIIGLTVGSGVILVMLLVWSSDATGEAPPDARNFRDFPQVGYIILAWLCLSLTGILLALMYQYVYYHRYFYDSNDVNLIIRKGAVGQKEATIPYSRITEVYVDQDFLDVIFGLYDVHVSTPTEQSGQFAHIDGVNREGSLALKELILDRIQKN